MTLVRRIRLTLDGWELQCNSDPTATIKIPRKKLKQCNIIGTVIQIMKDLY